MIYKQAYQTVDDRISSFSSKLEWRFYIQILPFSVFLLPFIFIWWCILILFDIDITQWIEGSMWFYFTWAVIIYAFFTVGTLEAIKILFMKMDENLSEFHKKQDTRNIEEIRLILQKIYKNIVYFQILRHILFIVLTKSSKQNTLIALKNELWFLINFSFELKEQLSEEIKEQRNKILNSKSDIEENLSWTPELLEVSEAQKLRLDRQIEQFEELQKRLLNT